ncbi:MAG: hypothetical protein A2Z99_17070 [Treponema sp. GWB1_62_6]|nr:MAG: hypothetical protein A2Z99_17070 [Treponema sp. GWB1_62_6]OHE63750.1 MAG: hypothetical protein A2001_00845 [Treponema sp. GWC1_61_84]OHE69263.1 MAG: hypothetical protein A2413_08905 [Treponema sp. RIFOXYC1_FULL_61_9]HCM28011.1 hypothetical protein [Treponema sp.]
MKAGLRPGASPRVSARSAAGSTVLVAVLLVAAALGVAVYVLARQKSAIARLEDRIDMLEGAAAPLRFTILSRGGETVSARFAFYDAAGTEIAAFERSWKGGELSIECLVVPVAGRTLVFPSRVFADSAVPRIGTELFNYYDRAGFPAVFDSPALDGKAREALSDLFGLLRAWDRSKGEGSEPGQGAEADARRRTAKVLDGVFAGAYRDVRSLRTAEVGAVYTLLSRSGVEIVRE